MVERVIEVANPAATRRAERAEAETAQLAQERTALQRCVLFGVEGHCCKWVTEAATGRQVGGRD